MYTSLRVCNYRSIQDSGEIPLGAITVVVGRNNTGKSALVRAPYLMQDTSIWRQGDIRLGENRMTVELTFDQLPDPLKDSHLRNWDGAGRILLTYNGQNRILTIKKADAPDDAPVTGMVNASRRDPFNLFLPALSGRRLAHYSEQISSANAYTISAQDNYLASRMLPLTNSDIPEAITFRRLCENILGVNFNIFAGDDAQHIGVQVDLRNTISLEAMGTGLSGTLGLLVGLSTATGKIFLIEEPEDDLHPKALKDLVDAIIVASERNQFLISTHSSTVLTRLGAASGTTVVHVTSNGRPLPTSSFKMLTERSERMDVLQDLGYTLADMDLSQGWLIFEESSAERLIRQYLARWFAPKLQGLRTVAARGNSRVRPLLEDFREMFLYAHLERIYRDRAWVIVDGDQDGVLLTEQLKKEFNDWEPSHFRYWPKRSFELYYPIDFYEAVTQALSTTDRRKRREAKRALLLQVIAWIEDDEEHAREKFRTSAAEVIEILQDIEKRIRE